MGGPMQLQLGPDRFDPRWSIQRYRAIRRRLVGQPSSRPATAAPPVRRPRPLPPSLLCRQAYRLPVTGSEGPVDDTILFDPYVSEPLRIRQCFRATAAETGLTVADLVGPRRRYALPRQIAMYVASVMSARSSLEIGRRLHRHHTTVLHGIDQTRTKLATDNALRAIVAGIHRRLIHENTLQSSAPETRPGELSPAVG
jgi:hypothetical protein